MENRKITVASSPHIKSNLRVNRIMLDVIIALVPVAAAGQRRVLDCASRAGCDPRRRAFRRKTHADTARAKRDCVSAVARRNGVCLAPVSQECENPRADGAAVGRAFGFLLDRVLSVHSGNFFGALWITLCIW